jgi:putative Ca2+/H+ antiporter (TMEM165/GDT1 family)
MKNSNTPKNWTTSRIPLIASAAALAVAVALPKPAYADEITVPGICKCLTLPASRALMTTFGLVFLAEWSDATQIGTAALVARNPEHSWQVLTGATLGLWAGAALAVGVGWTADSWLPKSALRRAAGDVFCAFGVFSAVHGL